MDRKEMSVFIGQSDATKRHDIAKLDKTIKDGTPIGGVLNVTVAYDSERGGYVLTGDRLNVDIVTDDINEIEAALQHDSGDSKVTVNDVLNGDGLPLFYNGLFRDLFLVRKGRVSDDDTSKAIIWGNVNRPELLKTGDIKGLRQAWIAAGKP